ncbi:hypothetical protein [Mycobacterium kiyosense]|uniref:hypothetical protein n=1 Tax=Mycobacterium kiyosense TaxID=2871094 RepID=UPI0028528648|nr:hypothetical protein [Mycobacterium kiyosense]
MTIRAISTTVGVSNGALYHSFGSRAGCWRRHGCGRPADSGTHKPPWWMTHCRRAPKTPASRPRWPPRTRPRNSSVTIRTPAVFC